MILEAHGLKSRSSCEERGLKCYQYFNCDPCVLCRSSCEERGLKYIIFTVEERAIRRSSCEERGLKCLYVINNLENAVAPRGGEERGVFRQQELTTTWPPDHFLLSQNTWIENCFV